MQEKEKAVEDHRQNVAEYRKFLESCDFIKVYPEKCSTSHRDKLLYVFLK